MTSVFCLAFLLLTHSTLGSIDAAFAFAHLPSTATASASSSPATTEDNATATHPTLPHLSANEVKRRIQSGRVYVHDNFLTEAQLKFLQRDMQQLDKQGKFIVNGLSDVRKGLKGEAATDATATASRSNQGFDVKYDRSVCPIPWWQDSLLLVDVQSSENDECYNDEADQEAEILNSIKIKLQRLRRDLADILTRPTMLDSSLGHECYYSKSTPGSSLARHMDERHEESKGPRGWLLPSRRSLSWLIYLSETEGNGGDEEGRQDNYTNNKEWDALQNGGMLRTFPQKHFDGCEGVVQCGSHNGNLQIGWLLASTTESSNNVDPNCRLVTHPIFLDCWYRHTNPYTGELEPHNILYVVQKPNGDNANQIDYITVPWTPDAVEGNVMEFLQHRALLESNPQHLSERLFLQQNYASQFTLLEDRVAWDRGNDPDGSIVEDILPKRGTLVVFDSVTLPHEVTPVIKGFRSALAGWFHEETQPLGG